MHHTRNPLDFPTQQRVTDILQRLAMKRGFDGYPFATQLPSFGVLSLEFAARDMTLDIRPPLRTQAEKDFALKVARSLVFTSSFAVGIA